MQSLRRYRNTREQSLGSAVFFLYIYFVIDFFLHLPARIPGYGIIRPTMLLALILMLILISQRDRLPKISSEPAFKAIFWLMLYVVVTLPLATWPGSVLFTNIPNFIKAVVFLFFTAMIVDTERRLVIFVFVFCACQVFRILEPLYLNITRGYWGSQTYLGNGEFAERLSGAPADVVNPNGLGFIIVTAIPYLHYMLWRSDKKAYKAVYLVLLPLITYALVLTMSRGAFIAFIVMAWMLLKESRHKITLLVVAAVGVSVIWMNLSDVHKDRYLSLISKKAAQSTTAEGRLQGMIDEFSIVLERPITGHGLGTSREAKAHAGIGWMISHDLYAEVLIEIGIIGFIIFAVFLKSIYNKYRDNMKKMRQSGTSGKDTYAWRLNSALGTVFWVYAVFSINYFGLSVYYWYMFAGLVIAFSRIYFKDAKNMGDADNANEQRA